MTKTKIIYKTWDPNSDWVAHIAIQAETNPPYVWRCYAKGETLPRLPNDVVMMPIKAARELFEFEEGELEQVTRQ